MAGVYLAGVGFRPEGFRLTSPAEARSERHTLTLRDLVATPEGTELRYDVIGLTGDEGYTAKQDTISIASAGVSQVLQRGEFSFRPPSFSAVSELSRRLASASVIPQRRGLVEISITIDGVGEFRVAAALTPFVREPDAAGHDVNTSVTHDGITVAVGRLGVAREETALEIEVAVGEGECCAGIGGYQGHRRGPTALSLRDESGRVYAERWQPPGPFDRATLARFEPLHRDARDLELQVPYIFVEQRDAVPEFVLPVTEPLDVPVGGYEIRVLASTYVHDPDASRSRDRASKLAVDLDLGGWHRDRRIVLPGRVVVDGGRGSVGYGPRHFNAAEPEPVDRILVSGERVGAARTLGFIGPTIQVRGPWRVRFDIARD